MPVEITKLNNLIVEGNAADQEDEDNRRGWFIGHFIEAIQGLRCTEEIEVKWGVHMANEEKHTLDTSKKGTTLTLLISGTFVVEFPDLNKSVKLNQVGDYVIFAPEVKHRWKVIEDSIVLTVRWPSVKS